MPRGKVGAVSAEWPLACPERLDQTRSEGRTGEDRRIQPESGAKTVAAQPRLGYAGLAGMAKMEILVKKRLGLEPSLHQILQVLSVTLFEKTPILRAFQHVDSKDPYHAISNQLILFDL